MKRTSMQFLTLSAALAFALACAKAGDKPTETVAPAPITETTTEVAGNSETTPATLYILKFHHDN